MDGLLSLLVHLYGWRGRLLGQSCACRLDNPKLSFTFGPVSTAVLADAAEVRGLVLGLLNREIDGLQRRSEPEQDLVIAAGASSLRAFYRAASYCWITRSPKDGRLSVSALRLFPNGAGLVLHDHADVELDVTWPDERLAGEIRLALGASASARTDRRR